MYIFNSPDKIKYINQSKLALDIGVTIGYLNRVLNSKITCSKLLAYCITKRINENAEIDDYFAYVEKN